MTGRLRLEPSPTITLSPITVPGLKVTPGPIWQLWPITTGPLITAVGLMMVPSPTHTSLSRRV
ncbi:hypothetical protein D3C72_831920 [compost metagenome]